MLEVVKRPTLYISRIKNIAIETFKSVKGLNPEYMGPLFFSRFQPVLYTLWIQIGSTKSKYD